MATTISVLRQQLRTRLLEDYALVVPGTPVVSPQGTPGASTVSYKITAVNVTGESQASAVKTITNANATLSAANSNQLTWTAVPGAVSYNVYRTATNGTFPTTLGLIGNATTATFTDDGDVGDGSTAPTINTSGLDTPFWTEQELLDYILAGCKDLWRGIIELHQGHFVTIDATNVSLAASATALTGVPADCFRILAIEPRDTTQFATGSGITFKPMAYKSRTFESIRSLSATDQNTSGFIYYDILNPGSPVAAPSIVIGPPITAALSLRLTYVHTLDSALGVDSDSPIPGESDNALIAWGMAYARAKEREDRGPDPAWLAIYATDKQSLLTSLTPRQEQEEEVVEDVFGSYWN